MGGKWRRSPLAVDSREGLRPTPERVRETVFDWLSHLFGTLDGIEVLDLFAGSGAMGFEAVSRGAERAVFVEKHPGSVAKLNETIRRLKGEDVCSAVRGDAFDFLRSEADSYDVVFIDPPYGEELQSKAVQASLERLKPEGLLYVEHPVARPPELCGLPVVCIRRGTAGQVCYSLFARKDSLMSLQCKLPKEKLSKAAKAQRRKEGAESK